jgi:hypothetical protein
MQTASEADRAELAQAVRAVQVQQTAQFEAMKETIVVQWIAIAILLGLVAGLMFWTITNWREHRAKIRQCEARLAALESAEITA